MSKMSVSHPLQLPRSTTMPNPHLPQQPAQIPAPGQSLQIICAPDGSATDDDVGESAVVGAALEETFEGDGVGCGTGEGQREGEGAGRGRETNAEGRLRQFGGRGRGGIVLRGLWRVSSGCSTSAEVSFGESERTKGDPNSRAGSLTKHHHRHPPHHLLQRHLQRTLPPMPLHDGVNPTPPLSGP